MKTTTQLFRAKDLWELPHDGQRHELVKGELRTMPPAGFEHGAIGNKSGFLLTRHVEPNKLGLVVMGDTGFLIATDPDTVRAPDVGFVSQVRLEQLGRPKEYFPGAPDLVVEVISPSDRVNEVDEKVEEWLNAGTKMVWVLNPRRRTVTVHVPGKTPVILMENDILDGGEVVPGFQCRVGDLFDL